MLDFSSVDYTTQSYVHALIGEALRTYGDQALARIEFRGCASPVRSLIELVVDYSLGGFEQQHVDIASPAPRVAKTSV